MSDRFAFCLIKLKFLAEVATDPALDDTAFPGNRLSRLDPCGSSYDWNPFLGGLPQTLNEARVRVSMDCRGRYLDHIFIRAVVANREARRDLS